MIHLEINSRKKVVSNHSVASTNPIVEDSTSISTHSSVQLTATPKCAKPKTHGNVLFLYKKG